jgi:hypothetical protein
MQLALIYLLMAGIVLGILAVSSASADSRPVQPLSVINRTHVPTTTVERLEAALTVQVNAQLDSFWYGRPHIEFVAPGTPGAWTITLVTGRNMVRNGYCGYHDPVVEGSRIRALGDVGGPRVVPGVTPFAVVGLSRQCDSGFAGTILPDAKRGWSIVFSHEVMEMMVDPWPGSFLINGQWPEVGDPVNGIGYQLLGVRVSDFVTPSYFWQGRGRYDKLGFLIPVTRF